MGFVRGKNNNKQDLFLERFVGCDDYNWLCFRVVLLGCYYDSVQKFDFLLSCLLKYWFYMFLNELFIGVLLYILIV